jgi:hypothetical protein
MSTRQSDNTATIPNSEYQKSREVPKLKNFDNTIVKKSTHIAADAISRMYIIKSLQVFHL